MRRRRLAPSLFACLAGLALALAVSAAAPASEAKPIVKSAVPAASHPGGVISYTVTISLPEAHTSVVVEDLFLCGVDYVPGSAKLDAAAIANPTKLVEQVNRVVYRFNLGSLPAGVHTLTVQGKVSSQKPCQGQKVQEEAHLFLDGQWAGNAVVNTPIECVPPPPPPPPCKKPSITKTASPDVSTPGGLIDYTVAVCLESAKNNVTVEDVFLYGVDFVPGSAKLNGQPIANPAMTYDQLYRKVYEFRLGNLAAGVYTLIFQGKVDAKKPCQGQKVTDEVHLWLDGKYGGSSIADTPLRCEQLAPPRCEKPGIKKKGFPTISSPGGVIDYTVAVCLDSSKSNVVLEEMFLYGVDYIPGSAKLNGVAIGDPVKTVVQPSRIVYEFRLGNLQAGGYTITFKGKVDPSKPAQGQKVSNEAHLFLNGQWSGNAVVNTSLTP